MKKMFVALFVLAVLASGYSYDQFLWAKKLIFGDPTTHIVQQGEYLSKIAQKYYGDAGYWRELALINRAPNSNLVFPGEEIIVPRLDVIKQIRRTRWLSRVNQFVSGEEMILSQMGNSAQEEYANDVVETQAEPLAAANDETAPDIVAESQPDQEISNDPMVATIDEGAVVENDDEVQDAAAGFNFPTVYVALAIGLVGLVGLIFYRKRSKANEIIVVDGNGHFDLDEDVDEVEPNYQDYLKKKRKNEHAVVN